MMVVLSVYLHSVPRSECEHKSISSLRLRNRCYCIVGHLCKQSQGFVTLDRSDILDPASDTTRIRTYPHRIRIRALRLAY